MSTQPKTETRMSNPLRWLVLALMASACVSTNQRQEGIYHVEKYQYQVEYRPTRPERYVYGVRMAKPMFTRVEIMPSAVHVNIRNAGTGEVTLQWDNSSLLIDGAAEPVVLVQPGFNCQRPDLAPSHVTLPPDSTFEGWLIPVSRLKWRQFAPEINAADYPPGYWAANVISRLLNPERPDLHAGYCENRDLFPLSANSRDGGELQRSEMEGLVGHTVELYLRSTHDGEEWYDRFEFQASRVVLQTEWKSCNDPAGYARFWKEAAEKGSRKTVQTMTIKECGYEYPIQSGDAND